MYNVTALEWLRKVFVLGAKEMMVKGQQKQQDVSSSCFDSRRNGGGGIERFLEFGASEFTCYDCARTQVKLCTQDRISDIP